MVVGEDSVVTDSRRILSVAMDLAILALTGILHFFTTGSIAIGIAGFSAIAMISFSGIVSSLVLTSRHSDTLGGGTRMTIGIPTPMPTHIPMITNHHQTGVTLQRMEPNIGAI